MKMQNINQLIASYPRTHPPLPQAFKDIYEKEYLANREGGNVATSIAQKLETWMHRQVAKNTTGQSTLELGAGTLNHLAYEPGDQTYDVVEPASFFYENSPNRDRVRAIYADLQEIPDNTRYDRVISIAVLEHLQNLPFEIARAGLLLSDNGRFQAAIPCEGELAWYLAWRLGTGIPYWLRNRLDYGILMRHEHINKSDEIRVLISHMFETITIKRFPIPLRHCSFYLYIDAQTPRKDVCQEILGQEY
ncbi:hypothetical protein [Thalassospira tepidiphila]|uniref:hypothetical protein n=1 Tax=Thalassospira tepidiphila TaxID=393657 RepID=UPI0030C768EE